jgi:hypothetical protein
MSLPPSLNLSDFRLISFHPGFVIAIFWIWPFNENTKEAGMFSAFALMAAAYSCDFRLLTLYAVHSSAGQGGEE